jgi:FMN phosphatase YigB (HAD superfamily)
MTTRFVYFDLGNVILNFDHAVGVKQIAAAANISEAVAKDVVFESGLQDRYETGLVTSQQFHDEFCEASKSSVNVDELMLACSQIFTLNQPTVTVINQLVASKIPIGILSNTCEAHWRYVQDNYSDLVDRFKTFVLSYESRSMKPDAKIYSDAIGSAERFLADTGEPVKPSEIFFMDDRDENVAGAVAAGLDAKLFRSADELIDQLKERNVIS